MAAGVVTPERPEQPGQAERPGQPVRPGQPGQTGHPDRGGRARPTPAWLRLTSAALVVLALAAAVVALLAVVPRQSATGAARNGAEPLLVDAQEVITSLSDADTTAAGSFLAGRTPPAADRDRFAADLARAAAATSAAGRLASTGAAGADVRTVAVGLPTYTGLVATAGADQRQGFPVAAAYLGEASGFLRSGLLGPASALYREAQRQLDADRHRAGRLPLVALGTGLSAALLVALLWLQRSYARRFRRLLNPPTVLATAAVVAGLVWSGVALSAQSGHLDRAATQGSGPLGRLTEARILALQARADDELTLVTRDSVPSYQADLASVLPRVDRLLADPGATAGEQAALGAARREWAAYQQAHARVRAADTAGDQRGAIAVASGPQASGLAGASAALDGSLGAAVGGAQATFSGALAAAAGDVAPLAAGLAVLSVLAGALVVVGAQRRLAEYR